MAPATKSKKTEIVLSGFHTAAKSGVEKASEAVAAMSASTISMDIISVGVAPTAKLSEIAGEPEDIVVGVYITVSGDIPGHALLVFPKESAVILAGILLGRESDGTEEVDEMTYSVLQEVGNIVTSSYLNALSDFYRCCLLPSPPSVAVDMAAAVVDTVLINTGKFDEETISIVTKFKGTERSLRGFFLYIPEISTSY